MITRTRRGLPPFLDLNTCPGAGGPGYVTTTYRNLSHVIAILNYWRRSEQSRPAGSMPNSIGLQVPLLLPTTKTVVRACVPASEDASRRTTSTRTVRRGRCGGGRRLACKAPHPRCTARLGVLRTRLKGNELLLPNITTRLPHGIPLPGKEEGLARPTTTVALRCKSSLPCQSWTPTPLDEAGTPRRSAEAIAQRRKWMTRSISTIACS